MVDSNRDPAPGFVLLATYLRAARGILVAGTGGVRKMRFGGRSRGKRGGLRVIYYYRAALGRIYLITVYAKNVTADLSMRDKQTLRRLIETLDGEG